MRRFLTNSDRRDVSNPWFKVAKQMKTEQKAAITAEKERKAKKMENTAIRDELRAKHGFNENFVSPNTARKLLIKQQIKAQPGKILKDILKDLPQVEKRLTAGQKSKLEKEAKSLEDAYNKQNAAAAVRAIAAKDWMALKVNPTLCITLHLSQSTRTSV